jgi:hypothetical protein
MSTELEGCPFSANTHIGSNGLEISEIIQRGDMRWWVRFKGIRRLYTYGVKGKNNSGIYLIPRKEYARLSPHNRNIDLADPWNKSPITKEEVWLRAYIVTLEVTSRQNAARHGNEAIEDFEARFLTPIKQA